MDKGEFIKKAKKLGYTQGMIDEIICNHENAEKDGVKVPWEFDLIELPVQG